MMKWLWLSLVVIVLDQATKFLASGMLILHQPVAVLPFFNLTLMHNTGAAFSFLHDASGWQRWFFAVLALIVSVMLVLWLRRLQPQERWLATALTLVLGGALGNLVDRLMYGYVVDFIQLYYQDWYYPAFNVADSAITVGAVMLVIDTFKGKEKHRRTL
ncbi:MAG: signal peptidase II [Gammaproteobacteria bacterium]|nr:signal peptidase II [Gammaproteobacteria bacterium]